MYFAEFGDLCDPEWLEDAVAVSISGRPLAAPRPRVLRTGRSYNPKAKEYRELAQAVKSSLPPGFKPFDEPVRVVMAFGFRAPKSWSRKRRAAEVGRPRTSSPDLSNLVKAVEDACEGVLWVNDRCICSFAARKFWKLTEDASWIAVKPLE